MGPPFRRRSKYSSGNSVSFRNVWAFAFSGAEYSYCTWQRQLLRALVFHSSTTLPSTLTESCASANASYRHFMTQAEPKREAAMNDKPAHNSARVAGGK